MAHPPIRVHLERARMLWIVVVMTMHHTLAKSFF